MFYQIEIPPHFDSFSVLHLSTYCEFGTKFLIYTFAMEHLLRNG